MNKARRIGSATLLVLAVLSSSAQRSEAAAGCPTTVGGGGVWPSARRMKQRGEACCMFEWVKPTHFGTVEELEAAGAPTSGEYCVDAASLEEFVAYTSVSSPCSQCGPYITEEMCSVVSNTCSEWGPEEPRTVCCMAYENRVTKYVEEVTEFHSFPWLSATLCPKGDKLVGYDMTAGGQSGSIACPANPETSNRQTIEVPGFLQPHFRDRSAPHALVFHRKKQMDNVKLKLKVTDANGNEVIPLSDYELGSTSTSRRHLLRAAGGGRSSKGGGLSDFGDGASNGDYGDGDGFDNTAGIVWTPEMLELLDQDGQRYKYIDGMGIRYLNENGYMIPWDTDPLVVGQNYAAIGGEGVSFWGTFQQGENSILYGLPPEYQVEWFKEPDSITESDESLSGESIWRRNFPIITWGQPFTCPVQGPCVFQSSQKHYADMPDKEFRASHTECDMHMDIMMGTVFFPDNYTMPFTVTLEDVEAGLDLSVSSPCTNGDQDINSVSAPGDAGLYVSIVRLAQMEVRGQPNFEEGSFDGYCHLGKCPSGGSRLWQLVSYLMALAVSALLAAVLAI